MIVFQSSQLIRQTLTASVCVPPAISFRLSFSFPPRRESSTRVRTRDRERGVIFLCNGKARVDALNHAGARQGPPLHNSATCQMALNHTQDIFQHNSKTSKMSKLLKHQRSPHLSRARTKHAQTGPEILLSFLSFPVKRRSRCSLRGLHVHRMSSG